MEADHTSEVVAVKKLLCQFVLRMAFQTGINNELNFRTLFQPLGDGHSIFGLLLQTQRQRADASESQPRIKGADVGAQIVVVIADAIHISFFTGQNAADGIAVAYIILRSGVDDNVGAPVQGPHNEGGDEGVVNNDLTAMSVGILRNGGDISQFQQGIGQGLEIDDLRIRLHRFFDVFQISDVYAGRFDALGRQNIIEHAVGADEGIIIRNDMIAGVELGKERKADGCHAAGDDACVLCIFQRSDLTLHRHGSGICCAAVDAAAWLPIHGINDHLIIFIGRIVGIGRSLVDGSIQSVGNGIGAFTEFDRTSGEVHVAEISFVSIHNMTS